jgi:hypothetical protein
LLARRFFDRIGHTVNGYLQRKSKGMKRLSAVRFWCRLSA